MMPARLVRPIVVDERPTLLVWGANDAITPAAAWQQAARAVTGCAFRIVPRCGHSPMVEQPHEFNRILLEFLAEGEDR